MQWSIAVGIPTESLLAPLRALLFRGVAGGTLIVIVLAAVAILMSRAIGRPIDALARAALTVAAGAQGKVKVEGPLEIATLAEAFNEMVDSRFRAERQTQESERALKALSDRLLVVQEEERTRIAREIHDDLGQALTALKMDVLGMLEGIKTGAQIDARMRDRVVQTLDVLVTSVQRISSELRPSILDDLGLAAAIESEARAFEHRTGIECEVSLPEEPVWRFAEGPSPSGSKEQLRTRGVATAIYRIIQEALTNVARHSDATRVELRVRFRGDDVLLDVRDDGRGVTAQEIGSTRSLGLIGIRERAAMVGGTVRFDGISGRGTILSVTIPFLGEAHA
jgi:signal transduction histidine kinase